MRVIAGSRKGHKLAAPRGLDTRPTSDRVRENIFNLVGPVDDAKVLDLFAGSGALGIEALSRGAVRADFVEDDRATLVTLRRNLEELELAAMSRVWPFRLPGGLARIAPVLAAADLVLADPPYGGEAARAVLAQLGRPGTLAPGVRVVLEHHGKDQVPERCGTLARVRERRYGETVVSVYRRTADDTAARSEQEEP